MNILVLVLSVFAFCFSLIGLVIILNMFYTVNRLKLFEKQTTQFLTQVGQNSVVNTEMMTKNFGIVAKRLRQIDSILTDDENNIDRAVQSMLTEKKKKEDLN